MHNLPQPGPARETPAIEELRAIRREIAALRAAFDDFAAIFLSSRFPYGKPADRFTRRPRG